MHACCLCDTMCMLCMCVFGMCRGRDSVCMVCMCVCSGCVGEEISNCCYINGYLFAEANFLLVPGKRANFCEFVMSSRKKN